MNKSRRDFLHSSLIAAVLISGCVRLKAIEAEVRGCHSTVDSGDGEIVRHATAAKKD